MVPLLRPRRLLHPFHRRPDGNPRVGSRTVAGLFRLCAGPIDRRADLVPHSRVSPAPRSAEHVVYAFLRRPGGQEDLQDRKRLRGPGRPAPGERSPSRLLPDGTGRAFRKQSAFKCDGVRRDGSLPGQAAGSDRQEEPGTGRPARLPGSHHRSPLGQGDSEGDAHRSPQRQSGSIVPIRTVGCSNSNRKATPAC